MALLFAADRRDHLAREILPALQAGAIGYLLKDAEPDEVVSSIR